MALAIAIEPTVAPVFPDGAAGFRLGHQTDGLQTVSPNSIDPDGLVNIDQLTTQIPNRSLPNDGDHFSPDK
jgi:hypothetical protein